MASDSSKSWLLGAGYDWRTASKSEVTDNPASGLSLTATRAIEHKSSAPPRPAARFRMGRLSYDINREQREVCAYYASDGKLRHRWLSRDAQGQHVAANDPQAWEPIDIAGDDQCVFILDRRFQIVHRHRYGRETLSAFVQSNEARSHWSRIELDESGCLLIFDNRKTEALSYDRYGQFLGAVSAAWPGVKVEVDEPEPGVKIEEPFELPPYPTTGYWMSKPLDSRLYNRQWHRIQMTVKSLPPGTHIEIKTLAYQQKEHAPLRPTDPRFVTSHLLVAPTQPPPEERGKKRVEDFLVQSGAGQFLSILIELHSDGFETAVIESLRVHYPRESYLEYLPPLYSADEPMRVFLERFLSIFQTEWDEFERRIEESEAFFDAEAVPEGVAMTYLASWLGLELEGSWKGEENRQLLKAVPGIYPRRGTVGALRDYVGVYLANFSGLTPEQVAGTPFPAIVEGFQERQYLLLSQAGGSTLGTAKPLWSAGVVKRLQLEVFSRSDEVELVSTGDPEHDFFLNFAHRFRLYAPAAWVRTAEQEQMLRRAIEAELPAHVAYELCLVEAGLRVGIQSTVGLDTIVGDPPALRLSCEPEKEAASLPPHDQLGLGAVLSGKGREPAVLDSSARVGDWILD